MKGDVPWWAYIHEATVTAPDDLVRDADGDIIGTKARDYCELKITVRCSRAIFWKVADMLTDFFDKYPKPRDIRATSLADLAPPQLKRNSDESEE